MKKTSAEANLLEALGRIESTISKVVATRGYARELGKIKMLQELLREQVQSNENSSHSTRPIR